MNHLPSRAVLCCLLSFASLRAQGSVQYSSRTWQMEDGLPHTVVQALTQTRDGYLWVGTREGLARFDGVQFVPFKLSGRIPCPAISSLCEARDGSLWIGTSQQGAFRLNRGELTHFTRSEGLAGDSVTGIQADGLGGVFLATQEGVVRWQADKVQPQAQMGNHVWCLFLDGEQTLWLAHDEGVRRIPLAQRTGDTNSEPLSSFSARSAYRRGSGPLWVGSTLGLTRWQQGASVFYPKGSGPTAIVSAVFEDRQGSVWVGTYGGLSRFVEGQFIPAGSAETTSCSVYAIAEDREGNVWVGSEDGLTRYAPTQFTTYTRRQGLNHDRTVSVLAGAHDTLWIGTWGGGVNRLKEGQFSVFSHNEGLANDSVYSLHETADGSLWIGLDLMFGLDRLKDGHFTHYGRAQGLTKPVVTVIGEDSQGGLWAGTRGGLYRFEDEKWVQFDSKDGLSNTKINALCRCRKGGLWIGTEVGLTRWNSNRFEPLLVQESRFSEKIFSLYEDAQDVLWIGTKGEGLKRLQAGRLSSYTTRQGLPNDFIYGILEDDRHNLWLSGGKGIYRLEKAQLEAVASGQAAQLSPVSYGQADGILNSSQFTEAIQPAASKDAQGRLWFRTTHGVAVTDPARIIRNELAPLVWVEEVLADNLSLEAAEQPLSSQQGTPLGPAASFKAAPAPLLVAPGRGELEIRYTALSFRAAEKNRFKYRLQGVDEDWVEAGTRRFAHYNNIAPGHYRFEVKACNNDGVWNESGSAVALVWQPHFWQTLWFQGLCGLLCAGALIGAARSVVRKRMERKLQQYEQQQALARERARIARDIHDDLGARVTQITLLSELSNAEPREELRSNARKIALASREMAQSLDEIVWAVNPEHDTLAGVVEYLSQSADEFLEDTSIRLRLNLPKEIPACTLSAQVRHHLFLAFREALNNAVKHAAATEIQIDLTVSAEQLTVSVADNGVGFEPRLHENGRNGLRNMRHRLESIGGTFDLLSQPAHGTHVTLAVSLNPHKCADSH